MMDRPQLAETLRDWFPVWKLIWALALAIIGGVLRLLDGATYVGALVEVATVFVILLVYAAILTALWRGLKRLWGRVRAPSGADRAQATGIANFFLALLVGAVMTWITTEITNPLMDHAKETTAASDTVGSTATGYISTYLTNVPVLFLFFALFSLLALSVFQREVLR